MDVPPFDNSLPSTAPHTVRYPPLLTLCPPPPQRPLLTTNSNYGILSRCRSVSTLTMRGIPVTVSAAKAGAAACLVSTRRRRSVAPRWGDIFTCSGKLWGCSRWTFGNGPQCCRCGGQKIYIEKSRFRIVVIFQWQTLDRLEKQQQKTRQKRCSYSYFVVRRVKAVFVAVFVFVAVSAFAPQTRESDQRR